MQARYSKELERLPEVYAAALAADVTTLTRSVESWLDRPMVMVGSGGSYSTATFAAWLHERMAKRLRDAFPTRDRGTFSRSERRRPPFRHLQKLLIAIPMGEALDGYALSTNLKAG